MKVISVNNSKGGVGKSTTIITLSQILACSGYKILVMDLDPQMNSTKILCPDYEPKGLGYKHLFCEKQFSKSSIEEFIVSTKNPNIDVFPAEEQLYDIIYDIYEANKEKIVGNIFRKNISFIKNDYDYIIIDNSPFRSYLTTCALFISDEVLVPIENDNFSYDGINNLIKTISALNAKYSLEINFTGVFITKAESRTTLYKEMVKSYQEMFGDKFIPISIRKTEAVKQANTLFVGLLDYDKRCNAVSDYIALAEYLGLMDKSHAKKIKALVNKKN